MRSTDDRATRTDDRATRTDDRTTRARIRDAAIECYGELGVAATSARKVAARAGVSAGSVIHHFGSMDGLRAACDEFVAERIRDVESRQMLSGLDPDPTATWRGADLGRVGAYLAQVLADSSPAVTRLVDDLVADAEGYLAEGVAAGVVRPTSDPRARAVVLTLWSLGVFVLHDHVERLLGVDLTSAADGSIEPYARPATDILTGVLSGGLTDGVAHPTPANPEGAAR